jgi:hypothetical protein
MNGSCESISSDQRHNHNCYAYLQQLCPHVFESTLEILPELDFLNTIRDKPYDAQIAYGNFYTSFLTHLEEMVDQITEKQHIHLDDLLFAVFNNDNHILDNTNWLKPINNAIRPQNMNAEALIADSLKDTTPAINNNSPNKASTLANRFWTLFDPNFKPQLDTNIPSIKHYAYRADLYPIEYRFGTQGQRHNGQPRVSPLFKHWLAIKAKKTASEQRFDHIYFNNMALDRTPMNIPGSNEKRLSHALHELEQDPSLKIAVITLPASEGLMNIRHYKKKGTSFSYHDTFKELFTLAHDEYHPQGIVDLKISREVRALLFHSKIHEQLTLHHLLRKSFTIMGIKQGDTLSSAQKQAVWLHFIKFELTHYILCTLKPNSYNFSCKDAIDRGALSSLYYNLHLSISLEKPMNRDEFEHNLNVAAANVKGRGMNAQRRVLWNALNSYITAHYEEIFMDHQQSWLIYWRDMNCPHSKVDELLPLRLLECEKNSTALPPEKEHLKEITQQLLAAVSKQHKQKFTGQRLLLEVVSRTNQLISEQPTPESIQTYKNLAQELQINHPCLLVISGIMQTLLGVLLLSRTLIESGVSKIKSGFFSSERKELCAYISNMTQELELESNLQLKASNKPI